MEKSTLRGYDIIPIILTTNSNSKRKISLSPSVLILSDLTKWLMFSKSFRYFVKKTWKIDSLAYLSLEKTPLHISYSLKSTCHSKNVVVLKRKKEIFREIESINDLNLFIFFQPLGSALFVERTHMEWIPQKVIGLVVFDLAFVRLY